VCGSRRRDVGPNQRMLFLPRWLLVSKSTFVLCVFTGTVLFVIYFSFFLFFNCDSDPLGFRGEVGGKQQSVDAEGGCRDPFVPVAGKRFGSESRPIGAPPKFELLFVREEDLLRE